MVGIEPKRLLRPVIRPKEVRVTPPASNFNGDDLAAVMSLASTSPQSACFSTSANYARNISSFCSGTPRNIASSHSGTMTVALSLQQQQVYLATNITSSSQSYSEAEGATTMVSNQPGLASGAAAASGTNHSRSDSSDLSGNSATAGTDLSTPTSSSCLNPSILSGSILIKVAKPTKIKGVSLSFVGVSKTIWSHVSPQSLMADEPTPHATNESVDELYINCHQWEFVPIENVASMKKSVANTDTSITVVGTELFGASNCLSKDDAFVRSNSSLSTINSRGCETITDSNNVEVPVFNNSRIIRRKLPAVSNSLNKDSYVLPVGEYVYNFQLAIDSRVAESVAAANGEIEYNLVAKVIRPSAFAMNLNGKRSVQLVRSPPNDCEGSLNSPVTISRIWDDRLQYEISMPKKYAPLGSVWPVQIKLNPLDKVSVHRVRVTLTESVDYISSMDNTLKTTDRTARIVLYERKGKTVRVINDRGEDKEKLVGDILDDSPGTTVLDANLPLLSSVNDFNPIPHQYLSTSSYDSEQVKTLRPDCSSSKYIRVRHRLAIGLRISKQGSEDSKRRHFDVKIDTPIILLAKCCSDENVTLPLYDDMPPLASCSSDDNSGWSGEEDSSPPPFVATGLEDAFADCMTPPPEYSSLSHSRTGYI